MGFNINKYDKRRFHKDELIHKRIKALLLWCEYQVYLQNLGKDEFIILLNNVVDVAIQQEWYEIAIFFRDERLRISNQK